MIQGPESLLKPRNVTTSKAERRRDLRRGFWGLFAAAPIEPGEIVWVSFLFPDDCDVHRWADLERRRELVKYAYQVDADLFTHSKDVDSDISNFLNHSCDPNSWYDDSDATLRRFAREQLPELDPDATVASLRAHGGIEFIVAKRPIAKDEEITMDYSTFWVVADLEFECRCGSAGCRRHVKKDDWRRMDPAHCSLHVRSLFGSG